MNSTPDIVSETGLPKIILGGMGVNISRPETAAIVSGASMPGRETLGTISGTAVERVVARMLQKGGTEAQEIIAALADFPFQDVSDRIIKKYFDKSGAGIPVFTLQPFRALIELVVCANYAFVKMAKKGHKNPVSINYLEKIQMPHLASIYGAMLANVDYVTMGAGLPLDIPAIFQAFSEGTTASYKISVIGATKDDSYRMTFNPRDYFGQNTPEVSIPKFLPIISTDALASIIRKKIGSLVAGFVIERPIAGGHNAPPRGGAENYGERDEANLHRMQEIGLPYWLAGGYASPEGLKEAIALGAVGIQVGSIFALCNNSGLKSDLRDQIIQMILQGKLVIETKKNASPTGFPFKVGGVPGTPFEEIIYSTRQRVCDECALRSPYKKPDGAIGYRCASEPEKDFVRKGGVLQDTVGKMCLCNGLISATGLKNEEPPIVTLGDDTSFLQAILNEGQTSYSALQALNYLFGRGT